MLILIGASASGKTEIAKLLIKNHGFKKLVTSTTRKQRDGEVTGVDYNFLTVDEFWLKKQNNEFFETVIYDNNYYGTPKKNETNNVLIVDSMGANNIYKNSLGHTFIVLTTDESIRKKRMLDRGDSLSDCVQRLKHDKEHFKLKKITHYDHLVDTTNKTLDELTLMINKLYNKTA